jgi:hypothetical protein
MLLQTINQKRFILAIVIISFLTALSYLSALGNGKGVLPILFYIFRFPTHTLLWDFFSQSSIIYRVGLVINVLFWSLVIERILSILLSKQKIDSTTV